MDGQQPPAFGPPGSYPGGPPQNPYAPPQAPAGYPGPTPGPYGYMPMLKPHRGGSILALGILGLVCCGICGIIA